MINYGEGAHGEMTLPTTNGEPRKGDWIQTYTNRAFFPMDPHPEDVSLVDIAHALSLLCRFGGHTRKHYSVAQHSVLVSYHCPNFPSLGLMHDATEAYLVDVPRPIKKHLGGYAEMERAIAVAIGLRFGLPLQSLPAEVHEQDNRALATEKRDLRGPEPLPWCGLPAPWLDRINPWPAGIAEMRFLRRAHDLGIK